jgi:hypothetical protein
MIGRKFGMLRVLSEVPALGDKPRWHCSCDCGKTKEVAGGHLRRGLITSCGCVKALRTSERMKQHGATGSKAYQVWVDMMARCYRPSCKAYANYGARGITVCADWHDVRRFLSDMGEPPAGLKIDRIDNDGPYSPENCRWTTHQRNCNNRRNTVMVEHKGRSQPLADWARELGINQSTLYYRVVVNGWPTERAFSPRSR